LVQADYRQVIDAFVAEMAAKGCAPVDTEIIPDGKRHRYRAEGDRAGRENGWYVLHLDDHPAGMFGTWRDPDRWHSWVSNPTRKLSGPERKALEEQIARKRREQEEEQRQLNTEAAARAQRLWNEATPATEHRYLTRKSISANGTRIHETEGLLIPMRSGDGTLLNLQRVMKPGEAEEKLFLYGGRVQGCYYALSKSAPEAAGPILICEGFATGASLHAATDLPVIVAFNTGNLAHVADVIRTKFPQALLILCADNDQWTLRPVENPGVHYALAAAKRVRASVAIPQFKWTESRPTDFNDLAQAEGLGRVAEIIENARTLPIAEPDPEPPMVLDEDHQVDEPFPPTTSVGHIDFPHLSSKGKALMTLENVRVFLDALGVRARYDEIHKDIDVLIPGMTYLVDTAKNDKFAWIQSQANFHQLPKGAQELDQFVSHLAGQNAYNPARDWILSKPWDGTTRLQAFYNTITATSDHEQDDAHEISLKELLMKRWMLSAVAAAFRPHGVSAHGVLTLQGEQNLGKTAWFKALVPAELDLRADGILLDPKDKDSVYQCVSRWLVELGEVDATFRKSDIAQLKSFLTKDRDVLRRPFARKDSEFARRTVFFASVNPSDFLADPTGNRRFWTIPCEKIDYAHQLEMQQVWAEFYMLYQAGEPYVLSKEEFDRLNRHNRDFESVNAAEELVGICFNWSDPVSLWRPLTATQIAMICGFREPSERILKQIARAVRERTGLDRKKSNGRSLYTMPPIVPANLPI
jgi:putative DNA primase/helicase